MAWTPPSDAVAVQPAANAPTTGWKPPSDAEAVKSEAPAPVVAKEETPPTGDAMGADLGAAIMGQAAPREPKTYTGSVFDTQPFNPPFDSEEATRLSRRAYAEQTKQFPRRAPPVMTESPEYVGRDRTVGETAVDLTAALSKGTTGFFKGILNNKIGRAHV